MKKDYADATSDENSAIASFEGLVGSKKKEIEALTKQIESQTARIGALGVKLAQQENDLEDKIVAPMSLFRIVSPACCKIQQGSHSIIYGAKRGLYEPYKKRKSFRNEHFFCKVVWNVIFEDLRRF